MRRSLLALCVIAFVAANPATAQEKSWTGKFVIVKKPSLKLTETDEQGKQVEVAQLDGVSYRVMAEDGDLIKLKTRYHVVGWLEKANTVLLDESVAYFTGQLQDDPMDLGAINSRAVAYLMIGEPDNAIKDFDDAIRLRPMASFFYNNRAVVWKSKAEYAKAIEDFTEAIRLRPNYAMYFRNRRASYTRLKEYRKALEDSNEAVRLEPTDTENYFVRGGDHRRLKEFDEAIADFSEAIRLDPDHAQAYLLRSVVWSAKQEPAKARIDWDEALRRAPKDARGSNGVAWLLATLPSDKARDGKRAVELAKLALKLEPDNPSYISTLAAAYAETGNFAEAVRVQERALQEPGYKNSTEALNRLELYRKKQPYRED